MDLITRVCFLKLLNQIIIKVVTLEHVENAELCNCESERFNFIVASLARWISFQFAAEMEGGKKRSFPIILLCVALLAVAGLISYTSNSFLPKEIQTWAEPLPLTSVGQTTAYITTTDATATTSDAQTTAPDTSATTTSTAHTMSTALLTTNPKPSADIVQTTLRAAIHIAKEAPRILFLLGSKLFATSDVATNTESNIYSVVKKNKQTGEGVQN